MEILVVLLSRFERPVSAIVHHIYVLAAEGKAEVYLNDQLAVTLLFVVEPQPQQ